MCLSMTLLDVLDQEDTHLPKGHMNSLTGCQHDINMRRREKVGGEGQLGGSRSEGIPLETASHLLWAPSASLLAITV